jgi:hypothetical protein
MPHPCIAMFRKRWPQSQVNRLADAMSDMLYAYLVSLTPAAAAARR